MSLAINKLSALSGRFLRRKNRAGAPHGCDTRSESSNKLLFTSDVAPDPRFLLAVGRETEEVRRFQEAIVSKASRFGSLQDDLLQVFAQTSCLLEDLEQTKSELAKRDALGKFEREARDTAVQHSKELNEVCKQTQSELDLLRPEVSRLSSALSEAENKIQQLEADGAQLRDRLAEAERDLAKHRELDSFARRELEAVRAELKANDLLIAQRDTDLAESAQRIEVAGQALASLNAALAVSQYALAQSATDLEDTQIGQDVSRNRILNLESELYEFQQEHMRMRSLWQSEADQHRADVATLRTQLDQATGVGGVHERLLAELRLELQARNDQLKQTERRALDSAMTAEQGAQKLLAAEAELNKALAGNISSRAQRRAMMRRVKPLIAALRQKKIELSQMALRIEDLEGRFDSRRLELESVIQQLQERMTVLVEDLEAERSRRILAEGALGLDRDKRMAEFAADDAAVISASGVRAVESELSEPPNTRLLLERLCAAG